MRELMILAGLALVLGGGAARAGETLTSEALLAPADSGKSEFYPGGRDAYYPGAAFGKDVFLVAWQAGRMMEGDIVGCRIDKNGKALDAKPFVISAAKDDQERPHVAFGAGVFLVVWSDLRNEKDYDVYAARVSPEGKVLDRDGILVSGGPHNQVRPRLCWDGESFLVVWMDLRDGKLYRIYCARVSAGGKVLDPGGTLLGKANRDVVFPAVTSSGEGRAVVLFGNSRSQPATGGVFLKSGKPTAEKLVPARPSDLDYYGQPKTKKWGSSIGASCHISIAAGKSGHMLVFRNYAPEGRGGVCPEYNCQLISADGKRELLTTLTGKWHYTVNPDVIWDGSAYVAAWGDQEGPYYRAPRKDKRKFSKVYVGRTDENGKPLLAEEGIPVQVSGTYDSPAQNPALASDGAGTTLIAYEKHPDKPEVPIKIGVRVLTAK